MEEHYPQRMNAIVKWFKNYKIFDGKKPNKIHFDDAILGIERTLNVIEKNYQYWKELREIALDHSKAKGDNGKELLEIAIKYQMGKYHNWII